MGNIANTHNLESDSSSESELAQKVIDDLIKTSKALAESVLSRPKCGCAKILCHACRRDEADIELAHSLSRTLTTLGL